MISKNRSSINFFWQGLFLFLLALLIYSNTFNTPFQFDDIGSIVNNHLIRDIHNVGGAMARNARVVAAYTFALNYHFHKLDVVGYHVVNFSIHILTAFLVWWFSFLILSTPKFKTHPIIKNKEWISFLAALIFVTHPVQTQAVTYLTQRFASLATLFYIATLCLYFHTRMSNARPRLKIFGFICAAVCAVLGMYTKAVVITLPLMIILIEGLFFTQKFRWKYLILIVPFGLIVPYIFSFNIPNLFSDTLISESHHGDIITFGRYFLTQFRVALVLMRLLFIPLGQNLDYDFPLTQSILEFSAIGSIIVILGILITAFYMLKKNILITFGILWFFVIFSINLIPRANIIAEHKLYLISIGFCLALATAIFTFIQNKEKRILTITGIILTLSFLTFQRNKIWKNEITLWQDVVKKSPNKPRAHLNLGQAYLRYGKNQRALEEFMNTLMLDPSNIKTYNSLGTFYYKRQNFDEALKQFNTALRLDPKYADAYINRANLYSSQKKFDLALADFDKAKKLKGGYTMLYANRGSLYGQMGKYDLAIKDYSRAIGLHMEYPELFRNRGNAYKMTKQYALAIADYNKSIQLDPTIGITYFHRSLAYHANGNLNFAIRDIVLAKKNGYTVNSRYIKMIYEQQKNKLLKTK